MADKTTILLLLFLPTFLLLLLLIFFNPSLFFYQNHLNFIPSSNLNLNHSILANNKNSSSNNNNNVRLILSNNISQPPHHQKLDLVHSLNFSSPSSNATIVDKKDEEKKMNQKKKSGLEKIEDGLAPARMAIREAARNRNYSSEVLGTFVPRGPIYRNPYAFHQSHVEMEKRFKVWIYKEGEEPLVHHGPMYNIYGIEGQFIQELEYGLNFNKFRAHHPDEAHAFFIPFSITNMVSSFYHPLVSYDRGPIFRVTLDYVNIVAERYPYWNRSHGADHFMLSCHDWAPEIPQANPKLYKNFIRALCNANTSEGFKPMRDVSIPEINIPGGGKKLGPPGFPLRLSQRRIFAFFAGGNHGHVRKFLFENWHQDKKDEEIQVYEYLPKKQNYFKMLGQSKYCLCPSGYEVASPRIVEAIQAECVPVLIKDNYSFPFNDVLDWSKFSIHIPVARIPEIKTILKEIPLRKYLKLLKGVKSVKWHFTFNKPSKPFDLYHMTLHSIWLRRLNIRLPY